MLTPIAPIIIALSASSPIWRGYLSDIDCRWNVLKQAFDDRTEEELGFSPLVYQRHILKKSRFDTTDCYLSSEGSKYNDFEFDKDEQVFQKLIDEGMDTTLAQHFANMFTRDPFLVFEEDLKNEDDEFSGKYLNNIIN
jgi:glutamate--cysteine ligase catalytic subunit